MSRAKLRQINLKIKTSSEIKKTTNAMRLISMSSRTRCLQLSQGLSEYKNELERILRELKKIGSEESAASGIKKANNKNLKKLLVLVGSQKGLCGNFNNFIVQGFVKEKDKLDIKNYEVLTIGKHLKDILTYGKGKVDLSYDKFDLDRSSDMGERLCEFVFSSDYGEVILFLNRPKGFFNIVQQRLVLRKEEFLLEEFLSGENSVADRYGNNHDSEITDYDFEQSYKETLNSLGVLNVRAIILEALLDSLIAESSTRFLSMDKATRNADDLIASLKFSFNKLRQSSITRELTDLSGSFMSNQ